MRKIFSLFFMCSLLVVNAGWGGDFASLSDTWCDGGNGDYSVDSANGRCVECSKQHGDAPDKTRAYWNAGGTIMSRQCLLGFDDHWDDKVAVSKCSGKCTSSFVNVPNAPYTFICVNNGGSTKTIGDSAFVESAGSNCWVRSCIFSGKLVAIGDTVEVHCNATEQLHATKCAQRCVENDSGGLKWESFIVECEKSYRPDGDNYSNGYKSCIKDDGQQKEEEKEEHKEEEKEDQKEEKKEEPKEEKKEKPKQNKPSCRQSRTTAEGVACCDLPTSVATWDGTHCNCVDTNKQFSIVNNKGACIVPQAKVDDKYTCSSFDLSLINLWKTSCKDSQMALQLIQEFETMCRNSNLTVAEYNRISNQVSLAVELNCQPKIEEVKKDVEEKKPDTNSQSRAAIIAAGAALDKIASGFDVNVWKNAQGEFNTARLASDSIAAVVLGTAGGLITSSVMKKHQVEDGFEDLKCTIGGQPVAGWGDEFRVGIQ
jgi:hypothetical protein